MSIVHRALCSGPYRPGSRSCNAGSGHGVIVAPVRGWVTRPAGSKGLRLGGSLHDPRSSPDESTFR